MMSRGNFEGIKPRSVSWRLQFTLLLLLNFSVHPRMKLQVSVFCVSLLVANVGAQMLGSSYGYGYPSGGYGSSMGSGYAGSFSPYGSPYGMSGMSGMSGFPGAMGGMQGLYGMNSMGYGNQMMMSGYGSPYSRFGSSQYVGGRSPFFYSPLEPFSGISKKAKKA
ncbi:hypothetical protein M3Y98_00051700 [Aphelenchoides besseyi]|nr:hypothetical protein M3Y98_00051700 [Aphelenchoides besseyi]